MAYLLTITVANPAITLGQGTPPAPTSTPPSNAQPNAQPNAPPAPAQPVFSKQELDQMTAPIALYPDDLLAQMLIAATYPIEVVQAQRWVDVPENAKLKGDQLADALQPQTWDPSVKSLVPFPQVLKMMSDKLDWTQRLGDAFLAQQAEVMESVQRLRKQAQDTGTLKTTEQQKVEVKTETVVLQPEKPDVVTQRETIVIQPSNPEVVYVPSYNPSTAYGAWPYPAYPPVYYPPPPAYYPGYYPGAALASGLMFGVGVASIAALSGCCNSNWGGNNVNINANRYNNINASNIRSGRANQLAANSTNWRHDSSHRGGVAYRDASSRQNFQRQGGARATPAAAGRDFRGYDGGQRGGGQRGVGQGTSRPPATGQRQAGAGAGAGQGGAGAGMRQPAAQRQTGAAAGGRQAPAARQQGAAAGGGAGGTRGQSQRQPAAFQGMGSGSQTRAQSDRGRSSMSSARSAPSRSMSGGGGARAGGGGARAGGGGGRGGGRR
jgi:hypothetical protein